MFTLPGFPFDGGGFGVEGDSVGADAGGEVNAAAVGADDEFGGGEEGEVFAHVGEAGGSGAGAEFGAEFLDDLAFFGEGVGVDGDSGGEEAAAEFDVVFEGPEAEGAFGGAELEDGEGLAFAVAEAVHQLADAFAGGVGDGEAAVIGLAGELEWGEEGEAFLDLMLVGGW